ncbi:MAG: prolyl oligopeptidase family serine peptidase [Prevotellaceae bacterium]|jgi:dipeptidyl aminopeptidase/acylaminoacyl peptidase|nr:prolyl oligopeptidase family serine peptidase [Prevotellaceae bacterium]
MKKTAAMLLAVTLTICGLYAQKKPLDHSVYDSWQSVANPKISDDGKYAVYAVNLQEGDGTLIITDIKKNATAAVDRGYGYAISSDSKFVVSLIKPSFEQTREAKIKKKKADEMPKDSLAIITPANGKVEKIAYVKSFKLPKESALYLAYELNPPADTTKGKDKLKKEKDEGNPLVIRRMTSNVEDTIKYVSSYIFSENGKYLVASLTPNSKDSLANSGVLLYNTANGERKMLSTGKGSYKQLAFDKAGNQLAYVAERDSAKADPKIYRLYYYTNSMDSASVLVEQATAGMPANWMVSEHKKPVFSEDGGSLFFGTAPIPAPKDTAIYDFEVAALDIWHYADDFNQPMQLKNLERERKRTFAAVMYLADKSEMVRLADENVYSVSVNEELQKRKSLGYGLGIADKPYRVERQWTGDIKKDVYTVNLRNGQKKLVKEALSGYPSLSINGKYISWYDRKERQYFAYDIANGTTACLTCELDVNVWDEENDVPDDPHAYGIAGWLEKDKAILLYDYYDIWQVDPTAKTAAINLTNGMGRANKQTFRYLKTDMDIPYIGEKETILLRTFDNVTKENGFYTKAVAKHKEAPVKRVLNGYYYSYPVKAKNTNNFLFTKSNFTTTPDLYVTSDLWKTDTRLSQINPQMKDYLWGSVELIKYRTFDNIDAEALLYKPENFDPNRKYPMMIYFYEKHTDDLYRHYAPAPSRSIINIPFFTSRGYIVLVPDIYYTDGHPGQSAYNAVVAVAEKVCKNPWVDKDNIGIQGQSWGGYQVAHLITRTNMFKAAGAGAPVANMTSAYGGVRWGTGMIRQFQYEHTQSRIGKTLWDGFDLYIENSPLFFADKVETPLLIMHNDNDGAVPWYQGIEYFTALRRLGKKVWMLQYNKEEHNLMERKNTKDLSIRLQQFFDHYLKGDKMPKWMKYGVPATQKGIDWGYELID